MKSLLEQIHENNIKTIKEVIEKTGVPRSTLQDWSIKKPILIKYLCLGILKEKEE